MMKIKCDSVLRIMLGTMFGIILMMMMMMMVVVMVVMDFTWSP